MALITLAQNETVLTLRQGAALVACSITATPLTDATPRAYLADSIAFGLREQGAVLINPIAPQDADFGAVSNLDRLFDIEELRLMEFLCASFAQVTWSTNVQKQDLNQYRTDLLHQIDTKRQYCKDRYGFGRGAIGLATIDLGFNAHMPRFDGDDQFFGF